MSLTTEKLRKLRKQVKVELCEGLKSTGRAANLLRHDIGEYSEVTKTADALERVTASVTEHIDSLLARRPTR